MMTDGTPKRYFWLKLQATYFNQLEQKKMRKQEHGKDMQIVYLRMMLLSLDKGGYIYYQGVYGSLEEELSEEFDEPVEIIKETLDYLRANNMVSIDENSDCFVPESLQLTGSESYSAERMRRKREKEKVSYCDKGVMLRDVPVTLCDEEIEKELEKESEGEAEKKANYQLIVDMYNNICVSFPRLTKLSDKRKKTIMARINQGYSLEDFKKLFEMAEGSSFLRGGNNRNWSANFDWLIADSNMAKTLDGNYSNRQKDGDKGGVQSESTFRL